MPRSSLNLEDLLATIAPRVATPVAIVLGSPRQAADLAVNCPSDDVDCYQMDLYQADRLRVELVRRACRARVKVAADLWDLEQPVQTAIYPAPHGGERAVKLDMVEQAFHILRPHGAFIVLSPYPNDELFPELLKKNFGKCRIAPDSDGQVLWCQRSGEKPRRRHEITFQARLGTDGPLSFLSRPGVFCYGRLDLGARALLEVMTVEPGQRILDLGCGSGTNGVFAGRRSGPQGHVTFVDSNVRALVLAEHNARANGLASFETIAMSEPQSLPRAAFDVVLTNPPYYAQHEIAQRFIEGARTLLRPGGRFYLVTKQQEAVAPLVEEVFGQVEAVEQRDYVVLLGRVS